MSGARDHGALSASAVDSKRTVSGGVTAFMPALTVGSPGVAQLQQAYGNQAIATIMSTPDPAGLAPVQRAPAAPPITAPPPLPVSAPAAPGPVGPTTPPGTFGRPPGTFGELGRSLKTYHDVIKPGARWLTASRAVAAAEAAIAAEAAAAAGTTAVAGTAAATGAAATGTAAGAATTGAALAGGTTVAMTETMVVGGVAAVATWSVGAIVLVAGAAAVVLAGAGYGIWYAFLRDDVQPSQLPAPPPAKLPGLDDQPAVDPAPETIAELPGLPGDKEISVNEPRDGSQVEIREPETFHETLRVAGPDDEHASGSQTALVINSGVSRSADGHQVVQVQVTETDAEHPESEIRSASLLARLVKTSTSWEGGLILQIDQATIGAMAALVVRSGASLPDHLLTTVLNILQTSPLWIQVGPDVSATDRQALQQAASSLGLAPKLTQYRLDYLESGDIDVNAVRAQPPLLAPRPAKVHHQGHYTFRVDADPSSPNVIRAVVSMPASTRRDVDPDPAVSSEQNALPAASRGLLALVTPESIQVADLSTQLPRFQLHQAVSRDDPTTIATRLHLTLLGYLGEDALGRTFRFPVDTQHWSKINQQVKAGRSFEEAAVSSPPGRPFAEALRERRLSTVPTATEKQLGSRFGNPILRRELHFSVPVHPEPSTGAPAGADSPAIAEFGTGVHEEWVVGELTFRLVGTGPRAVEFRTWPTRSGPNGYYHQSSHYQVAYRDGSFVFTGSNRDDLERVRVPVEGNPRVNDYALTCLLARLRPHLHSASIRVPAAHSFSDRTWTSYVHPEGHDAVTTLAQLTFYDRLIDALEQQGIAVGAPDTILSPTGSNVVGFQMPIVDPGQALDRRTRRFAKDIQPIRTAVGGVTFSTSSHADNRIDVLAVSRSGIMEIQITYVDGRFWLNPVLGNRLYPHTPLPGTDVTILQYLLGLAWRTIGEPLRNQPVAFATIPSTDVAVIKSHGGPAEESMPTTRWYQALLRSLHEAGFQAGSPSYTGELRRGGPSNLVTTLPVGANRPEPGATLDINDDIAAMAALPAEYQLDLTALPTGRTTQNYDFTLTGDRPDEIAMTAVGLTELPDRPGQFRHTVRAVRQPNGDVDIVGGGAYYMFMPRWRVDGPDSPRLGSFILQNLITALFHRWARDPVGVRSISVAGVRNMHVRRQADLRGDTSPLDAVRQTSQYQFLVHELARLGVPVSRLRAGLNQTPTHDGYNRTGRDVPLVFDLRLDLGEGLPGDWATSDAETALRTTAPAARPESTGEAENEKAELTEGPTVADSGILESSAPILECVAPETTAPERTATESTAAEEPPLESSTDSPGWRLEPAEVTEDGRGRTVSVTARHAVQPEPVTVTVVRDRQGQVSVTGLGDPLADAGFASGSGEPTTVGAAALAEALGQLGLRPGDLRFTGRGVVEQVRTARRGRWAGDEAVSETPLHEQVEQVLTSLGYQISKATAGKPQPDGMFPVILTVQPIGK